MSNRPAPPTDPVRPRAPVPPARSSLAAVVTVMVIALGGFVTLWLGVLTTTGLTRFDGDVVMQVAATRSGWVVTMMTWVSDVGAPAVLMTFFVVALTVLAWRQSSLRTAVVGLAGLAVLDGVDVGVKALVARPRPPVQLHAVTATGFSFPSGHTTISTGVVLLLLWVIVAGRLRAARPALPARGRAAVGFAAVAVVAIGSSRIVLGVHYPSDVLAGWCLAVLVGGAVAVVDEVLVRRAVPAPAWT